MDVYNFLHSKIMHTYLCNVTIYSTLKSYVNLRLQRLNSKRGAYATLAGEPRTKHMSTPAKCQLQNIYISSRINHIYNIYNKHIYSIAHLRTLFIRDSVRYGEVDSD